MLLCFVYTEPDYWNSKQKAKQYTENLTSKLQNSNQNSTFCWVSSISFNRALKNPAQELRFIYYIFILNRGTFWPNFAKIRQIYLFNLIRLKQRNSHKIRPEFSAPITLHQKGCQPTRSHRRAVEYKLSSPRGYNSNKYIFEEKFHFFIIMYRFQKREHSSISEINRLRRQQRKPINRWFKTKLGNCYKLPGSGVTPFYTITKSMRVLWLVNQLWAIVPVNPRKNLASSELLYKSNKPQVSMGYRLINHLGCW